MDIFRTRRRLGLGREVVLLVAMWGVGALLLVSLIDLNGRADRARQRQVVVGQLREAAVDAPWIAFNGAGASDAIVARRLAGIERRMHGSVALLVALGDDR